MRYLKTYTCAKCGRMFEKWVGGIIPSNMEMDLWIHPVCDRCKANAIIRFFKPKK